MLSTVIGHGIDGLHDDPHQDKCKESIAKLHKLGVMSDITICERVKDVGQSAGNDDGIQPGLDDGGGNGD
jgi:hypothetical protein